MKRFAIRTVKNGTVKINGVIYFPSEQFMKYDGRLDNKRFAFGIYDEYDHKRRFVSLWGNESSYKCNHSETDSNCNCFKDTIECVNGSFPWVWWYESQKEKLCQ